MFPSALVLLVDHRTHYKWCSVQGASGDLVMMLLSSHSLLGASKLQTARLLAITQVVGIQSHGAS